MKVVMMKVIRVDGRFVWANSPGGHYVSFGDVHRWKPRIGQPVRVTIDSDEYPVKVEIGAGWRTVWP